MSNARRFMKTTALEKDEMRFTTTAFWLLSASLLTGCGFDQDTHVQTKNWDFQLEGASEFARSVSGLR